MALSPQKSREIVFQLLYSHDFLLGEGDDMIDFMMEQLSVTKKSMKEAEERYKQISSHLVEIDEQICRFSLAYDFDRIGRVEKSILRLGVYELCHQEVVPSKVAISEAIRLTRKFSTSESGSFINAVLDSILKDRLSLSEEDQALATTTSSS